MIDEKALTIAAEAQLNAHRAARGLPPGRLDQMRPEHRGEWLVESRAAVIAYLSAVEQAGWVLAPREPTGAMCLAGREESKNLFEQPLCRADAKDIYRAMLAASPAPAVDNAGWRPIASAPKDGTRILAWHQNDWSRDPRWRVIYWTGAEGMAYRNTWLCDVCTLSVLERNILGWQPLPSAPSQDAPQPISQDQDRG